MSWTERDQRIVDAWETDDLPTMSQLLSEVSIERAWRPRDEFDVDVHPESFRGKVLALYDAYDEMPRWLRILSKILVWRPWR